VDCFVFLKKTKKRVFLNLILKQPLSFFLLQKGNVFHDITIPNFIRNESKRKDCLTVSLALDTAWNNFLYIFIKVVLARCQSKHQKSAVATVSSFVCYALMQAINKLQGSWFYYIIKSHPYHFTRTFGLIPSLAHKVLFVINCFRPHLQRCEIITGKYEPTEKECEWDSEAEEDGEMIKEESKDEVNELSVRTWVADVKCTKSTFRAWMLLIKWVLIGKFLLPQQLNVLSYICA